MFNVISRSSLISYAWLAGAIVVAAVSILSSKEAKALILCDAIAKQDAYPVDQNDDNSLIKKGRLRSP
jgi:hypothetical protein